MAFPRALAVIAAASVVFVSPVTGAMQTSTPDRVTVPLIVQTNRPFVDLTFHKKDGSVRTARFLIDSGGGDFYVLEPLARDLGLTLGKAYREDGTDLAPVTSMIEAAVGAFPLKLNPRRFTAQLGSDGILPPAAKAQGEGVLPGHVLAQYHVVFDYPAGTFTIANPGVLTPKGDLMPMPVGRGSGFPRTEVVVDGKTYGMLVDTGASFTMVSEVVLKSWGAAHPDWPRHPGAFGDAATLGGTTLETMFVPAATWGKLQLNDWGVTSQREGTFEKNMSAMMKAPVVGSLAGNVFRNYRLELDYANEKLYVSK